MRLAILIYIDADATPRDVVQSTKKLAQIYGAQVTTISSIDHHFEGPNHITVDAHPQAVDMEIVSRIQRSEQTIVVTQDYGLAALVLGKGALALSPNGMEYTDNNMDRLLFERDLRAKERRATGRSRGPKPRTAEDAEQFRMMLKNMLDRLAGME